MGMMGNNMGAPAPSTTSGTTPQPGVGGKGGAMPIAGGNMNVQDTSSMQRLGGKGTFTNPGAVPPRDMGTGAPPFDPNNPRATGIGIFPGGPMIDSTVADSFPTPGFPPRDMGTGAPPFDPNNPRATGIGMPMAGIPGNPGFPGPGGPFPPRDMGTGAPPFDPNNPRAGGVLGALSALFGNINGLRPTNQQPPQVGPFGGFSGDPKPLTTNIPRGPVTPPTGPMVPVRGGGMAPASIAPMMKKSPVLGGLAGLLRGRR